MCTVDTSFFRACVMISGFIFCHQKNLRIAERTAPAALDYRITIAQSVRTLEQSLFHIVITLNASRSLSNIIRIRRVKLG